MGNEKVSIIVPVYNTAQYLPKCLDGLINQTYKNIEIVCVNDGSTDNSPDILREYANKDDRIVIIDCENGGLSSARNIGNDVATGDYIMFCDSDDWLDTDAIEALMTEVLAKNADAVKCCYLKEFGDHSVVTHLFETNLVLQDNELKSVFYRRLFGLCGKELAVPQNVDTLVSACMQILKRDLCKDIKFVDTKIIGTEDLLFQIETYKNCRKFVYIDRPFYHYRKDNETSLTTVYKPELYEKWQTLYSMINDKINEWNLGQEYEQALKNRIALSMIGIGLNEIKADKNIFEKAAFLRKVLKTPRYKSAYKALTMKYFPLHWWVFFALSKMKFALPLVLMLETIEFLRKRVK